MTQIGQLHAFSKLLYEHLVTVAPGETATYDALSAIIGQDVRDTAHHYLDRARRLALKRDRRVFDVVRGVGLIRVENAGVVSLAETSVVRLRRAARRGIEVLSTVDLTKLSREDLTRAHVARAQMGLAQAFTGSSSTRRLTATAEGQATLPSAGKIAAQSLRAFQPKA